MAYEHCTDSGKTVEEQSNSFYITNKHLRSVLTYVHIAKCSDQAIKCTLKKSLTLRSFQRRRRADICVPEPQNLLFLVVVMNSIPLFTKLIHISPGITQNIYI